MKILVINSGSSSLKFQLFEKGKAFRCLFKGMIDRIGQAKPVFIENGSEKGAVAVKAPDHTAAVKIAFKTLLDRKLILTVDEISAVGHRVVHGGEKYRDATPITPTVLKQIKKLCELAPLHNPPNLASILACRKILPKTPQVAVFDTAFHQTIPEKAFLYAIPFEYYKRFGIRRYGFHGTSHRYVANRTAELLGKKTAKIIVCHLGNGSSITAVDGGRSIDTSMGFTPLEGLPMGTRCGDIDPAVVFELQEMLNVDTDEIDVILNKHSGLKGLSGIGSDMRDLWGAYKKNSRARLTVSLLAYRIAKYIGAYAAALKGLDAISFTAGMGEKAWYLREEACGYLKHLGVKINSVKNRENRTEINTNDSKVKVFVVPTDEEKEIAMETSHVLSKKH
jgi:acetate kinase